MSAPERVGWPVTAASVRRILRDAGHDPQMVVRIMTQAAWPGSGETLAGFASVEAAEVAATALRAAWVDGCRRVGGMGVWVRIDRNGAEQMPPSPEPPAEFTLSRHAWAWLVWIVLHNDGRFRTATYPYIPDLIEWELQQSPWTAYGPPDGDRPRVFTLHASAEGRALVNGA